MRGAAAAPGGIDPTEQSQYDLTQLAAEAAESIQWHDDLRAGMFHIHCHKCGASGAYLPPEFFGLLESEERYARAIIELVEIINERNAEQE